MGVWRAKRVWAWREEELEEEMEENEELWNGSPARMRGTDGLGDGVAVG